jgi:hypothetical protein
LYTDVTKVVLSYDWYPSFHEKVKLPETLSGLLFVNKQLHGIFERGQSIAPITDIVELHKTLVKNGCMTHSGWKTTRQDLMVPSPHSFPPPQSQRESQHDWEGKHVEVWSTNHYTLREKDSLAHSYVVDSARWTCNAFWFQGKLFVGLYNGLYILSSSTSSTVTVRLALPPLRHFGPYQWCCFQQWIVVVLRSQGVGDQWVPLVCVFDISEPCVVDPTSGCLAPFDEFSLADTCLESAEDALFVLASDQEIYLAIRDTVYTLSLTHQSLKIPQLRGGNKRKSFCF